MRLIPLVFLLCLPLSAQVAPLDNWAGFGPIYSSAQSPHFAGWAALALPVSSTAQIYSFTMYQALPVPHKTPTTSTTTGAATILRSIDTNRGQIYLIGLATAGAATGATATTGAFAGGGGVFWKLVNGLTISVVAIQNKAGTSTSPAILGGVGLAWGGKKAAPPPVAQPASKPPTPGPIDYYPLPPKPKPEVESWMPKTRGEFEVSL